MRRAALLPWQQARPSRSLGTSSATLSQSRQTHQASWRSNHSHIPSRTSPPLAPEANDHASHAHPQTRKASHSLDFNFDVQETGGSSERTRPGLVRGERSVARHSGRRTPVEAEKLCCWPSRMRTCRTPPRAGAVRGGTRTISCLAVPSAPEPKPSPFSSPTRWPYT